ncbi:unnamed protein product [Cyprideis torosa]|uniref:indole-3-glycerol-phosphate synthase n=1 Tax=Cyprideis torosa TaxID=163714 RepID=A0A7R8WQA1_9CRUS|nr:unnamed protein product [Cyprideis torosa]CAG0907834.1 unnamed protein product [Cyprideis torosa]
MKETLNLLYQGESLSQEAAYKLMTSIGEGQYSHEELASLLTVYNMRDIRPEELLGFRKAMIDMSLRVNLPKDAIDIVGTGGDGKDTFNISTLSCFVVAGAGFKIVKHGNYSASSVSGSSHMMEHFGYSFSNKEAKLQADLERSGICFLHAPLFHPAMKHIVPVRKALKVRTIFNIMGPLINPAQPNYALYGTYNQETAQLYHETLKNESLAYGIVNSLDGYDEVSLTGQALLIRKQEEEVLSPADFGFSTLDAAQIKGGGNVEENAKIFLSVLKGEATDAQTEVVLANAALALLCLQPEKSLEDCVQQAKESLKSKNALVVFNLAEKRKEVAQHKETQSIDDFTKSPYFDREVYSAKTQLLHPHSSGIIAEFKRKSPSKGWIFEEAIAEEVGPAYQNAGAACISVLTDEAFFGGTLEDLIHIRRQVEIPILRKEFIIDEYQLYEAKAMGADFILLIAEVLSTDEIKSLSKKAKELGLEVLMELHGEDQLPKICDSLDMVGINNRNLETFEVDLDRSIKMLEYIPNDFAKIAESGISGADEVLKLKQAGFDGFLIGENFMKTHQPGVALKSFMEEIFGK